MNSIDDSKLSDIKLDDTQLSSTSDTLPQDTNQDSNAKSSFGESNPPLAKNEAPDDIPDEDYIRLFSSLLLDQINTQDVKAVLESQQEM